MTWACMLMLLLPISAINKLYYDGYGYIRRWCKLGESKYKSMNNSNTQPLNFSSFAVNCNYDLELCIYLGGGIHFSYQWPLGRISLVCSHFAWSPFCVHFSFLPGVSLRSYLYIYCMCMIYHDYHLSNVSIIFSVKNCYNRIKLCYLSPLAWPCVCWGLQVGAFLSGEKAP